MEWVTWRRVWAACVLAGVVLYTVAFRIPEPGFVFSGFLLNSGDPWGYMAFSRRFAAGGFLIDNPFSLSPAKPAFFNLLWFLVGKTQALLGLGFLPVYYGLGVVASGLMFFSLWAFCREFLGEGPRARLAFTLAGTAGGLGWIPALLSDAMTIRLRPIDLYHHEGYPLVSALFFPHLAFSIAALVTIMLWFHRAVATGRRVWSLGAAGLLLCLGLFHPYHVLTVALVAGVWVTVEQVLAGRHLFRGWFDLAVLGAGALGPALYYRWLFSRPNWSMWAAGAVHPLNRMGVVLGLGPMLLLALVGALRAGRATFAKYRFHLVWVLVGLGTILSYPLLKFGVKLVEGLVVPLSVLGSVGLFGLEDRSTPRQRLGTALLVPLLLFSPIVLVVRSLQVVHGLRPSFFPSGWTDVTRIYEGDLEVRRYLEENPLPGAVLMTPQGEGRILAGTTNVGLFISDPALTPEFDGRWEVAMAVYYSPLSSLDRCSLLKWKGVTHLWYSPAWRLGFEPGKEPCFEPVFVNRGAGIWRIVP